MSYRSTHWFRVALALFAGALLWTLPALMGAVDANTFVRSVSLGTRGYRPVEGPEDAERLRRVSEVLMTDGARLLVLDPATRERRRLPIEGRLGVFSGPTRSGVVAWAESTLPEKSTRLKVGDLGGARVRELDRRSFEWVGARFSVFGDLTLSPDGRRIAFSSVDPSHPREWRWTERAVAIEVWDVASGRPLARTETRFDTSLAWRGEDELLVVRHVDLDELPPGVELDEEGRALLERFERPAPVLCAWSWAAGELVPLAVARRFACSPSGERLLLRPPAGDWTLCDRDAAGGTPLELPGLLGPVGLVDDDLVVYVGAPTEGQPTSFYWSLLKVPQLTTTLKVGEPETGAFATLLAGVSRHHRFAVGR